MFRFHVVWLAGCVVQRAWQESPWYWHPRGESLKHFLNALFQSHDFTSNSMIDRSHNIWAACIFILWRNHKKRLPINFNWRHIGHIWSYIASSHGFRPGHQAASIATRIATGTDRGSRKSKKTNDLNHVYRYSINDDWNYDYKIT